jgi:uncharacterized membrane protein
MANVPTPRLRPSGFGGAVACLAALSLLPCLLWIGRVIYTRSFTYSHVLWNLFLAWVPVALVWIATEQHGASRWIRGLAAVGWLIFLPNSPYLITDLIHLRPTGQIPLLFDGILLFSLGLSGLAIGLITVYWMEQAVVGRFGRWARLVFSAGAMGMAGFGVYVGRFLRWNSWDVLVRPLELARELAQYALHPFVHWRAWAAAALFTLLFASVYWPLRSLAMSRSESGI